MSEPPTEPPSPEVPWNVAFLVRDFPKELRTIGPQHFNGIIDEAFLKPLRDLGNEAAGIQHFLGHYSFDRFSWFGFRVTSDRRLDAITEANHRMAGLIDAVAICHPNAKPVISGFAWVGEGDEPNLQIVTYHLQGWADFIGTVESQTAWKRRDEELRTRVSRFNSLAIDFHSRSRTALARQIRHSLRMFRHGQHAGSWGVEFICKFCALEGLVCGELTEKKLATLVSHLTALFPESRDSTEAMVRKLWDFRSTAVHTAQAFDAGCLTEGGHLGVHIGEIEFLFTASLVFALERLYAAENVQQLWAGVSNYTLPDFARLRRPDDLARYAIKQMEIPMKLWLTGGGELFRKHLQMGKKAYDAANAHPV